MYENVNANKGYKIGLKIIEPMTVVDTNSYLRRKIRLSL